ncbi:MAG: DUF4292 domain-containing protein [Crocinitomicaceae bacterium]|nr:DUF4292 domain-containing protein [Crocinitomicaceae bacterium]
MTDTGGAFSTIKHDHIVNFLDSLNNNRPYFLVSRMNTKYSDDSQNATFKTSLRINKDTNMWSLFTYAGVPLITTFITNDSIKLSNKREKCYVNEGIQYLANKFGVDFSMLNLQSIFLGGAMKFNKSIPYNLSEKDNEFILSKADEKLFVISYYISNDLKYINKIEYATPNNSIQMVIQYLDYYFVDGYSIPKSISATIKTVKNNISLSFNVEKIELNQPKDMVIVIPETYEKCN